MIEPGEINYEQLFHVLPFNNHAVTMGPMPAPRLVSLLAQSEADLSGVLMGGIFPRPRGKASAEL